MKRGIRSKVILTNSLLIGSAILLMTFFVINLVQKQLNEQTFNLLKNKAYTLHASIEQRIGYLVENTQLLTSNELMINALTDDEGREAYLPKLVQNFMEGKDVISLNVVDFDGKPIFQTQELIPRYNESSQLRTALAVGETSIYLSEGSNQLVVVSPIKYYDTTQGAVVVEFDISAIAKRNIPLDSKAFMRLEHSSSTLFEYNVDDNSDYQTYRYDAQSTITYLKELGITLEIGLQDTIYSAPVKKAVIILSIMGLIFIGVSIILAALIARGLTRPILELHQRVEASNHDNNVLCSPLGTNDELEELAAAFDERTLKLQYQAEHDSLTELPNRVLFIDRLQQGIKTAQEHNNRLAVLFIDLDRFKEVNDSFGHDFGDRLLVEVSEMVEKVIRKSDSIARLGGDEFLVLLNQIEDDDIIIDTVQKIMACFKEPFTLDHHQFYITSSIGIAIYPNHGQSADELIKNSDAAMYKAKDEGRNTYNFYTDDMTEKALERVLMETELRQALKNEEFEVYFQPQVDMENGRILGMESLIRWKHPKKGLIPPFKFIPLAEETGLIVEIDRWMMITVMRQFAHWQQENLAPGILSLNLSMIQLNHEDFIDAVKIALFDSRINPVKVMFEVTETQVMRNPEHSIIVLRQLKELGVGLAIDDFGTGHSSLSYLKRLPIDKIKIDQSFVRDIPEDKDDMALTRAIIALSLSLGLDLIAEGVETEEQSGFLKANGCFEAQGYLYYKPIPMADTEAVLKQQLH
jgi:diguanylate cyclase (GGDEF)-like protein